MEQAGIPLNDTQLDAVRDLAAGRIDFTDYLFRVDLSPPLSLLSSAGEFSRDLSYAWRVLLRCGENPPVSGAGLRVPREAACAPAAR